jgi:hypothetical protein
MIERNHIINLSTYEKPCIEESRTKEWVDYLMKLPNGKTEEHYDWLIDRYRYSATNNAVISNMARLIYGKGLDAYNANRKPSEYAQMLSLLDKKVLRKVVLDLKMLGGCAFQVIYDKKHTKIVRVDHFPMNLMRPNKCNEKGEIEGYWFCDDWSDTRKYEPEFYPTMGTSKKEIEVLVVQPYAVGMKYFSEVDYFGALPYCVLEEEIADYLINDCQNGFAPTTIINYNNDEPDEETRERITKNTIAKTTGSKGKRTIVSFNANKELATTVETIPLNDAPEHYQYLADEARNKILASHGVVSPMLVGIVTDSQGFNSNADEIEVASKYFYNTTINHFQELIIDAIDKILAFNNIALDLYFEPVGLLDRNVRDRSIKAETPLTLSKDETELQSIVNSFGEDESDEWELIDSREVDYDNEEDLNLQVQEWEKSIEPKKTILRKIVELVGTGRANPNVNSEQDRNIDGFWFKVRYKYTGNASPERGFCKAMMSANKIYKKEDIDNMSNSIVNAGFGENGADTYDIFLYKGGARCHHKWERRTYVSTKKVESIGSNGTNQISTNKAEKFGYRVRNPKEVAMMPNDMPLKGFSPNNKNLPKDVI